MSKNPLVSIIMGSTSDLPIMEKAAARLDALEIPFEILALSAHRTPAEVEAFAKGAHERGIKVIIGAAGMAAHLCGVIASMAMVQMPPGIPVATVGINAAENAAILAVQMIATNNPELYARLEAYKESLKTKVVKANEDLSKLEYKFKTN